MNWRHGNNFATPGGWNETCSLIYFSYSRNKFHNSSLPVWCGTSLLCLFTSEGFTEQLYVYRYETTQSGLTSEDSSGALFGVFQSRGLCTNTISRYNTFWKQLHNCLTLYNWVIYIYICDCSVTKCGTIQWMMTFTRYCSICKHLLSLVFMLQVSTQTLCPSHLMDSKGQMRVALRFLPHMSHSELMTLELWSSFHFVTLHSLTDSKIAATGIRTSMETGEVQIWVKDCKNLPSVRGLTIDPFVKR